MVRRAYTQRSLVEVLLPDGEKLWDPILRWSLSARMRQPGLEFSERRLVRDWPERFGHPLLLLETFVDPARFRGAIYRAANGWRWAKRAAIGAPGR